jgi:hypothetical protein
MVSIRQVEEEIRTQTVADAISDAYILKEMVQ